MYTNIGLVQHVKRAFKEQWKYVWGTIGNYLTQIIISQKQAQYPEQINKYLSLIQSYIGLRSVDCVNLIKSYLWWNKDKDEPIYDIKYDKVDGIWMSADGAFQVAKEKGNINTIPEIEGVCVYYKGHIGVYIGNGEVIEARGTKYGVVKTKLKDRPWTNWLKYPDIKYLEDNDMDNIPQWKKDCADYLVKQGYLNVPHDPLENVDIGMLGAILKNRDEKIKEILKQI